MQTSSPSPPPPDKETIQALLELERLRMTRRNGSVAYLPPAWTWGSRIAAAVLLALCAWSIKLHGTHFIYFRGVALPAVVALFPECMAAVPFRRLRAVPVRLLLIVAWGALLILAWPSLRALAVLGFTR